MNFIINILKKAVIQMENNMMILNGINIGISKIELDESDLRIIDKSGKYCFRVFIYYNWNEIDNIKTGEKVEIDFNEYTLSENNESALIWPTNSYVKRVTNDSLCFYFHFENISETITYMNQRNAFDIVPSSLEVKVLLNHKDAKNGSIVYEI